MNATHGILQVWTQGDGIARGVLIALLLMSLASWWVIAIKALNLLRARKQAVQIEGFWQAADMVEGLAKLEDAHGNPFRRLVIEGREAAAHHSAARTRLQDALDPSDWISRALHSSIDHATARLQGGLAILASVGATAPFVGLFGTVWGIYHALMRIGAAGQANIEQVAGPIGEALIMTALGLAVAIPAVLGYNALIRGNKHILIGLGRFAHDLHAYYLTGARITVANTHAPPPLSASATEGS
jgi:biopolymer transport protein ExbB